MKTKKKSFNPFYFVLVLVGIAFCVTCCAYLVLTVRGRVPESTPADTGLLAFMDQHGVKLLAWELGALAVFTFAAIGTDSYWDKQLNRSDSENGTTE